jgi:hypothetical protein
MEFNREEVESMITMLRKAGLHPKTDSTTDLKEWIKGMSEQEEVKVERDNSSVATVPTSRIGSTYSYFPKIPFFSGEVGKDTTYDLWQFEVDCLLQSKQRSADVVLHAVRKSLKGDAAQMSMKLGHKASLSELLVKLKSAFGTLRSHSILLSDFYSITQGATEDVSAWSCRLESLVHRISERRTIPSAEQDDMLRTRMWDGLRPELKSLAAHKYDSLVNFDDLRLSLREIELELNRGKPVAASKKVVTVNSAASSVTREEITELKNIMLDMRKEVSEWKDAHSRQQVFQAQGLNPGAQSYRGSPHNQHGLGYNGPNGESEQPRLAPASYQSTYQSPYQSQHTPPRQPTHDDRQYHAGNRVAPTCFRCGQLGHIARGCRTRLDHMRRPLNSDRPMGRGRP